MKLATTTNDLHSFTKCQTEAMEYLKAAGFSYLDYSFSSDYHRGNGIYSNDLEGYTALINKKAEELGVKFVQSHAPMGKPLLDEDGKFLADTMQCVKACGALGIPSVVVHSGYDFGLTKEECFERNKKFYEPLLEAGEYYNVDILVENFNKMNKPGVYWIDNAPDLLELIEYVDHPRFHAVWDAGHANMQEMPQDEALRMRGSHVRALHIQDNMGDRDTHMAPFFGTLNLDAVMHGLIDIDYQGYFTFEIGNIFLPANKRREYPADKRLANIPLDLKLATEHFYYEMGKSILKAYDLFEE